MSQAVWSNSAIRFGRVVVYFQPSSFNIFGRPVSAVWASLFLDTVSIFKDLETLPRRKINLKLVVSLFLYPPIGNVLSRVSISWVRGRGRWACLHGNVYCRLRQAV